MSSSPASSPPAERLVTTPRQLFRPDPVLGWRLTPGYGVRVGFRQDRQVIQMIDEEGWRAMPRPETPKGPRLALYGCSFTYGTGLADDETFAALLQQARPELRILNRGIGGHGTVQNLLQFRRDIARSAVDAAIFCVISDHRFRNIAHPQRMRQYLRRDWFELGVEHVPVARQDGDGSVRIIYAPLWQPVINEADFHLFLPDDHMITSATLAVMGRVAQAAEAAGIPLRFALLDALDPDFNAAVMDRFPDTLDASTPHDPAHRFLPQDIHPNVHAGTLYAARLAPVADQLCETLPEGDPS